MEQSKYDKENGIIGSLWEKEGRNGRYMSGEIWIDGKQVRVVCFANRKRPGKNDRDWTVKAAEDRPAAAPRQEERQAYQAPTEPTEAEKKFNDDIPF